MYASFAVSVIRFILNTILLFIKDPDQIHPLQGQATLIQDNLNFLVLPAEHPVIYSLLGVFSIIWFYWIWMNATGIKNAGEKVTGTIAWSASLTIYFAIVLLVAAASPRQESLPDRVSRSEHAC